MTTYLLICLQHIIIQGISFDLELTTIYFLYMFAPFHYTIFVLKADDGIFIDIFATYYYIRYILAFKADNDIFIVYSQHIIILGIFLYLKLMMTYFLIYSQHIILLGIFLYLKPISSN